MGLLNRVGACTRTMMGAFLLNLFAAGFALSSAQAVEPPPEPCGEQPVNVCIMLDRTGSVSTTNRNNEAAAAKSLIDKISVLNNGTRVFIGRFGDETNGGVEAELRDAEPSTAGFQSFTTNYPQAKSAVDSALSSSSSVGTNVKDAIDVCKNALVNNDNGKQKILVLISDFDPSEPTNPDASALSAATSAKNAGVRIFAIGFDVSGATSADDTNRALGASIASGNASDNFCTSSSCNAANIVAENADGDDWFLSPTGAELNAVFDSIFVVLQCQDDGNACTLNSCNPDTNFCESTPIGNCLPCQTVGDCSDGNVCTNEACVEGRCEYTNNNSSCEDGDGCTLNDACSAGRCQPGGDKECDDGRSCSVDECISPSGQCDFDLSTCQCNSDADCEDDNACTDDKCNLDTGVCTNVNDNTNSCSDGSLCTSGDSCVDGQCLGSPVSCNDNNPCTDDSCNPETGCAYENDDTNTCGDNKACTVGDACVAGECVPGEVNDCNDNRSCSVDMCLEPSGACNNDLSDCQCSFDIDCNDQNPCTDDTCNVDTGQCSNTPNDANSCDDSNACTSGDHCDASQCVGSAVTCGDNNPCTDDSCDPGTGCVYRNDDSNICSDENGCTLGDACVEGACVPGGPKVCDDNRVCSEDSCEAPNGDCRFDLDNCGCNADEDCNDNNSCTDDVCNLNTGMCSNAANDENSCDDNDACSSDDQCVSGQCVGEVVRCDDGNDCTDDSCDSELGCVYSNDDTNTCSDENGCSVGDACVSGACVPGGPKVCNDNRSCSADSCEAPGGECQFDLAACLCNSDGDCNDNNPCTDDSCNLDTGECNSVNNDANSCDDANACTSGDQCVSGECQGEAVSCNDNNPCTDDACDPASGCEFTNDDSNDCNDDDGCTDGDQCVSGSCVPGEPKSCNDGRSCSEDQCLSPSGQCDSDLSGCECSADIDCNDNNPCTADTCNLDTGLCNNAGLPGQECDDGSVCTLDDQCNSDGTCGGTALDCDDNDECTTDSCSPELGCANTEIPECRPPPPPEPSEEPNPSGDPGDDSGVGGEVPVGGNRGNPFLEGSGTCSLNPAAKGSPAPWLLLFSLSGMVLLGRSMNSRSKRPAMISKAANRPTRG